MAKLKISGEGYKVKSEVKGLEDVEIHFKPITINRKIECQNIISVALQDNKLQEAEKQYIEATNDIVSIKNLEVETKDGDKSITTIKELRDIEVGGGEASDALMQLSQEILMSVVSYLFKYEEEAKKKREQ